MRSHKCNYFIINTIQIWTLRSWKFYLGFPRVCCWYETVYKNIVLIARESLKIGVGTGEPGFTIIVLINTYGIINFNKQQILQTPYTAFINKLKLKIRWVFLTNYVVPFFRYGGVHFLTNILIIKRIHQGRTNIFQLKMQLFKWG